MKLRPRVSRIHAAEPILRDSDDEEDEDAEETAVVEGEEVWPPINYDHLAPVSLPQGPRTTLIQNLLTQGVMHDT